MARLVVEEYDGSLKAEHGSGRNMAPFVKYEWGEEAYAAMHRKIESELTEVQRYILEEKEYGGRTLEDIARELGMEPAAARMQLSRARKTLRKALENDG